MKRAYSASARRWKGRGSDCGNFSSSTLVCIFFSRNATQGRYICICFLAEYALVTIRVDGSKRCGYE